MESAIQKTISEIIDEVRDIKTTYIEVVPDKDGEPEERVVSITPEDVLEQVEELLVEKHKEFDYTNFK